MAGPFYVDSNAAGTNDGTSWTNAWTSFWSVPTLASGEIVYVASNHVEASVAAHKTLTGPTSGEPAYVYSCTSGTTTYAAGAQVKTTGGSYSLTVTNAIEIYGVTLEAGSTTVSLVGSATRAARAVDCTTKGASAVVFRVDNANLVNHTFDLTNDSASASNQILDARPYGRTIEIIGGSVINATNRTGTLASFIAFVATGVGGVEISGVDLSALPSTCELVYGASATPCVTFVNCKLPATYSVLRAALTSTTTVDLFGCENAETASDRVRMQRYMLGGYVEDDKTVYMTDANAVSSDDGQGGTVAYSWKMVSENTAGEVNRAFPLVTPWIYSKITSTGSKNLDVYFGGTETLDDAEVWVEVQYMGTSGVETFTLASTQKNPTAAAATYTTTGGTWNATVTEEYYGRAAVTVNETGLCRARVCVGAVSKTIYVNPKLIVS